MHDSRRLVVFSRTDYPITNSLMRTAFVIIRNELADDVIEVCKTENDEVVESFMFKALYPVE